MIGYALKAILGLVLFISFAYSNKWHALERERSEVIAILRSTDFKDVSDWQGLGGLGGLGGLAPQVVVTCELIGIEHNVPGEYIFDVIGTALSGDLDELYASLSRQNEFPADYTWSIAGDYVAQGNTEKAFFAFLSRCPTSKIETEVLEFVLINASARRDENLVEAIIDRIGDTESRKILEDNIKQIEQDRLGFDFAKEFGQEWRIAAGSHIGEWITEKGAAWRVLNALREDNAASLNDLSAIKSDPKSIALYQLYSLRFDDAQSVASARNSFLSASTEDSRVASFCRLVNASPTEAMKAIESIDHSRKEKQLYIRLLAAHTARTLSDKQVVDLAKGIKNSFLRSVFLSVELTAHLAEI